jgi:hypothetical protein
MDFNQYVRILVDTDVNTHFIVSLPRVSTVAELRELIKVTHKHCYPDTGDVRIGKLAVGSSPSSLRVILLCTWIALLFALLVRPHICLQNLVPFFWPFCSRFA